MKKYMWDIIFVILFLFNLKAHAGVTDGTPVNAATTNAAFVDKNTSTTFTIAKTDFQNTAQAASGDGSIKSEGGGYITKDWWVNGTTKAAGGLNVGVLNTTLGTINMFGSTSGTVTIKPQAAAGTYNLNLPITAGTSGQVLTSAGGGASVMTWTNSIYSDSASQLRVIYVFMAGSVSGNNCTSDPCVAYQTSGGFGTLNRNSQGQYTLNFSPAFSVAPVCTCGSDISGARAGGVCGVEMPGTGSVIIATYDVNGSTTSVDSRANVICIGPK